MSIVFLQHQLLRCQTIGQCMMLNADVRKGGGGWSNANTCGQGGGGYENRSFFADVLYGRPLMLQATYFVICNFVNAKFPKRQHRTPSYSRAMHRPTVRGIVKGMNDIRVGVSCLRQVLLMLRIEWQSIIKSMNS